MLVALRVDRETAARTRDLPVPPGGERRSDRAASESLARRHLSTGVAVIGAMSSPVALS